MSEDDDRTLMMTRLWTREPQPVDWLWEGRIPLGNLTLIAGLPGLGKGLLGYEIASRLSRGQLEGACLDQPLKFQISSTEDMIDQVIVPRVIAAGGDLEQMVSISVKDRWGRRSIVLPDDLDIMEEALEDWQARYLLLDPLTAHVSVKVDSHRDQDMRRVLTPLAQLADRMGMAIVLILHVNKNQSDQLFQRLGASIAISAAARSILLVAADPDDEQQRILAHVKCNLGALMPPKRFRIERLAMDRAGNTVAWDDRDYSQVKTGHIVWVGGDLEAIPTAALLRGTTDEEGPRIREAVGFLEEMLGDGQERVTDIRREAKSLGISDRTLDRAKIKAGIRSKRVGEKWYWALSH